MSDKNGVVLAPPAPEDDLAPRGARQIPDPQGLIERAHDIGLSLGYRRVRLDRGLHSSGAWYEVGYGCGEITVRMSGLPVMRIIRQDSMTGELIAESLRRNLELAK